MTPMRVMQVSYKLTHVDSCTFDPSWCVSYGVRITRSESLELPKVTFDPLCGIQRSVTQIRLVVGSLQMRCQVSENLRTLKTLNPELLRVEASLRRLFLLGRRIRLGNVLVIGC